MILTLTYAIRDLAPYINWIYFFHAWEMPPRFATVANVHGCPACRQDWINAFPEEDRTQAREALRLYEDARAWLNAQDARFCARARFGLFAAHSEGDDILIETDGKWQRLPFLRQQETAESGLPHLCMADFISPVPGDSVANRLGLFATTVDEDMEHLHADGFLRMLTQTLCDRLAEAAAEKMHEEIRKTHWGYASGECLSIPELLAGKYQGLRPAIGYPSMPDQSLIFLLDGIINLGAIGIRLTENGMMQPHAATCGLILGHPATRHFSIGAIGEDQLRDYARRRGLPVEVVRKFLSTHLHNH